MDTKVILIFFHLMLFVNSASAQNFNCNLFSLIQNGIQIQNKKYQVYLSIKDSVKIVRLKNNQYKVESKNKSKRIDSLILYCNFKYIFDDKLFHLNGNVVVIDTFEFFSQICNKDSVFIINKLFKKDIAVLTNKINDTVILKSIKTYRNNLVISLMHSNSKYQVQFYINLVANLPPRLEKIVGEEEFIE